MPLLHDQLDERDRDTLARCERFAGWYETIEAERAAEEQMAYDLERQHESSQDKAEADREWYRQFGYRQAALVTQYLAECRDDRAAEEQMAYDLERQHESSQDKAEADREWYRQFGYRQAALVTQYLAECRDDRAYNVAAMSRATILTLAEQLKE